MLKTYYKSVISLQKINYSIWKKLFGLALPAFKWHTTAQETPLNKDFRPLIQNSEAWIKSALHWDA